MIVSVNRGRESCTYSALPVSIKKSKSCPANWDLAKYLLSPRLMSGNVNCDGVLAARLRSAGVLPCGSAREDAIKVKPARYVVYMVNSVSRLKCTLFEAKSRRDTRENHKLQTQSGPVQSIFSSFLLHS